ncbi:MAG: hypothetical protein IJ917_04800, partial [Firmicutes bacterium]|nr:hypothetical protein [Bacillota bacterium]
SLTNAPALPAATLAEASYHSMFKNCTSLTNAPALLPAWMRSPIACGAMAMLLGLIIVPIVSLFSKSPDKMFVDDCFACYEKPTVVEQKTALGK